MGLFRRRGSTSTRDEALPFLTVDEAGEVRELAARAFATAGREVVIHPDRLVAADGQAYGLWNVAAACKASGSHRQWSDVVEAHVSSLLDAPVEPGELPVEEILAHAVLRLYGAMTIPAEARPRFTYAHELAEGLIETVVLDTPTTVLILRDEDVERCGRDALWAAGLEHLVAEPLGEVEHLDLPGGAVVQAIEGESVYTASKLLVLPDVLRRVHGERAYPDGLLVAVPDRNHLLLHPVDDADVIPALQGMASLVGNVYASAVGGVSPSVYWWLDGRLERLSAYDDHGSIQVVVGEAFGEVLSRLTEQA